MLIRALCLLGLLAMATASSAHHSTQLNFSEEIGAIEGQVKAVRWANPHCSFVLEVSTESGATEDWLVEMLAKIALQRQGFDFEAFAIGQQVKVTGRMGRRPHTMYLVEAELPDGRKLKQPGPIR